MALNVLDSTGLSRFWAGVKSKLAAKADLVDGRLPQNQSPHIVPQKITDYLYYLDINFDLDYDKAVEYGREHSIVPGTACSAVRKGKLLGRNLDWMYAETAEFIINTRATKGRHASIGVATGLPALTNAFAQSGAWSDLYEILPFGTCDGVNDQGVCVEMNAVSGHTGFYATIDDGNEVTLALAMIPRYILDYADSASHAVSLLENVDIIPPFDSLPVDVHFMVADKSKTYVVEFVPDGDGGTEMFVAELPDDDHPAIMTNFYMRDYLDDGTIIGGGAGRYNTLVAGYDNVDSQQSLIDLLASVYSTVANHTTLVQRDGTVQHTTHSVVYDISSLSMTILPQPDVPRPTGEQYRFAVKNDITAVRSWDDLTDKPFYEETLPAVSITNPDYTSAAAVSFNASASGFTIPCKALRVADYLPQERMVGARLIIAEENGGETAADEEIEIDDTELVEIDHGYMHVNGFPLIIVTGQDQTVNYDEDGITFSVTLPTAGMYFLWVDVTGLTGSIMYVYSLQKAALTVVHKLASRFVDDSDFLLTAEMNPQTLVFSNVSKSYAQVKAAFQAGKNVRAIAYYSNGSTQNAFEARQGHYDDINDEIQFHTSARVNLGFGLILYTITITYSSDGTVTAYVRNLEREPMYVEAISGQNNTATITNGVTFNSISLAWAHKLPVKMRLDGNKELSLVGVEASTAALFSMADDLNVSLPQLAGIDMISVVVFANNTVTMREVTYNALTSATGVSF